MPITWRNVGQTVGAGAAADLMDGATRSIEGGLDRITSSLRTVEGNREDKFQHDVDKNISSYFDRLNQANSVEELEQLENSGELESMVQGFGQTFDTDRTRGALDDRRGELRDERTAERQSINAEHTFKQNQLRKEIEPLVQESYDIESAEELRAFVDRNQDQLVAAGAMGEFQDRIFRQETKDRADEEYERKEQEREWRDLSHQALSDFASSDANFYEARDGLKAALKDVPAHIADEYRHRLAAQYALENGLSEQDAWQLEQVAEAEDSKAESALTDARIARDRIHSDNAYNEQLSWNQDGIRETDDVTQALLGKGIDATGQYTRLTDAMDEAFREISVVGNDMKYLDGQRSNDPYDPKSIPPSVRTNRHAILEHAVGKLDATWWQKWAIAGGHRIKGGDEALKKAIQDSTRDFLESQRQKDIRDQADREFNAEETRIRNRASANVNIAQMEARLRAGSMTQKEAQRAIEQIEEDTGLNDDKGPRVNPHRAKRLAREGNSDKDTDDERAERLRELTRRRGRQGPKEHNLFPELN